MRRPAQVCLAHPTGFGQLCQILFLITFAQELKGAAYFGVGNLCDFLLKTNKVTT